MKDQVLSQLQRFWRGFLAFTPGQKVVTVAAVLALGIGGWLFSSWASTPSYAPLFTNLAPTDASAIIDKLNANKTPYKLAANGTEIMVAQKDVYQLRLAMSSSGLPSSGNSGYSLLDQEGITTSEFKQQVDFQRALEGELSKTIKSINGVADAQVHLAIPQQTVFDDGSQKPTASVLLTTTPGTTLTSGQVQSVVNLVSSSVPGLTTDQVSVSDSSGKVLSAAGSGDLSTESDTRASATQAYQQRLSSSAQAILDKILGPGNSVVTTNADLDFGKSNATSTNYSFASGVPPLAEASTGESLGNGAATPGAAIGANTVSAAASPSASSTGGYSKVTDTKNNAIDTTTEVRTNAPGDVKRLSVSVVLNSKAAGAVDLANIKAQIGAAVGLNPARGDVIAVSSENFDTSAAAAEAAAAAKAAKAAAAAKQSAQLISLLKTGGVVLLVIAVVIITLIANKRKKNAEPPDDLDLFLSTLQDDPNSLPPAPIDIIPPQSREAQIAAARQQQLAELAENDPQEIARLLRSWLNAKDG
ncbi:flagellar basal-body MS-ring/collar protein FliF [Jatrophihabitans sp. DSM 45814]